MSPDVGERAGVQAHLARAPAILSPAPMSLPSADSPSTRRAHDRAAARSGSSTGRLAAICLLAATALGCSAEEPVAKGRAPWFVEVAPSGVDFVHDACIEGGLLLPEIMGGGIGLFDCDGDGDLDLYCVNGGPDGTGGKSALYLNDGTGAFARAGASAGVEDTGYGMGLAIGDFDNDGDEDLYVACADGDRLLRNDGSGTFDDVTESAGIDVPGWSCSAAFLDYDRDGFLDVFVTQYVIYEERDCKNPAGRPEYCGPLSFDPVPDVLLRNRGDGTFEDISAACGIQSASAAGLGIVCEDFNRDGWVDMYVANDAYQNHLWINQQDGTFIDEGLQQGVALSFHGRPEAGMGVLAEDLSGDGEMDLFVTHLLAETNRFYRSQGEGRGFKDDTGRTGLAASSMKYTGFGTCAFDVELDGDLDIVVANGRVNRRDATPGAVAKPPLDMLAESNLFYRGLGNGRLEEESDLETALCVPADVSRGLAQGDIDGDGDLDLVMTNIDGPTRVYRNEAPREGSWLLVDAVDPELGRRALGAVVELSAGQTKRVRTIRAASGYLSSQDPRAHFGIPRAETASEATLLVRWPGGQQERFPVPSFDAQLTVERGAGEEVR